MTNRNPMPMLAICLTLALPYAFAGPVSAAPAPQDVAGAQGALSADQVRSMLMRQGYTEVKELKLDDGQWKAKARDADGDWDTLHVDARSGSEIDDGDASALTSDQVLAKLESSGYSGFGTLKYDDGEWTTQAMNAAHKTVELTIDGRTGRVTREKETD